MISRLTASAALFAVIAAAGITFAAHARTRPVGEPASAATSVPVVVMPMVQVTGRRANR